MKKALFITAVTILKGLHIGVGRVCQDAILVDQLTESRKMAKIAVVSFEHFLHGDERDRLAVANEVYEAFSTVGWVYLKDTGISQEQVDGVFALVRSSAFHRQPQ
jgi:hypothetical protein